MALPQSWVDHLFGRLAVRYGAAFFRQWPDIDPAAIKADWADVLDGVQGDSITYALRYLPATPVNAMQFRSLCRAAPAQNVAALPAPDVKADPDRVRALMARLKAPEDRVESPAQACARYIAQVAHARGGKLSSAQKAQLEAMGYA